MMTKSKNHHHSEKVLLKPRKGSQVEVTLSQCSNTPSVGHQTPLSHYLRIFICTPLCSTHHHISNCPHSHPRLGIDTLPDLVYDLMFLSYFFSHPFRIVFPPRSFQYDDFDSETFIDWIKDNKHIFFRSFSNRKITQKWDFLTIHHSTSITKDHVTCFETETLPAPTLYLATSQLVRPVNQSENILCRLYL